MALSIVACDPKTQEPPTTPETPNEKPTNINTITFKGDFVGDSTQKIEKGSSFTVPKGKEVTEDYTLMVITINGKQVFPGQPITVNEDIVINYEIKEATKINGIEIFENNVAKDGSIELTDEGRMALYNLNTNEFTLYVPQRVNGKEVTTFKYVSNSPTTIVLPETINKLDNYALSSEKLISVEIPYGITELPIGLFQSTKNLNHVDIPNSVTTLGESIFSSSGVKSVSLPSSLETIPNSAFHSCSKLESVIISEGPTSIGNGAFKSCTSLKSIEIPGSIKTIGNDAFKECSSLKSIVLEEGLETIKDHAFSGSAITELHIPTSVKHIAGFALVNCKYLTTIYYEGGEEAFLEKWKLEDLRLDNITIKDIK